MFRRQNLAWIGLFVLAACLVAIVPAPGTSSVGWSGDFETGDFSQWPASHVQANPGDAVIVASPARQGRYAAKFTVDPGDNPIGSTGERSQVYADQATTDGYEGREQWWAWSTMLAPGSVLFDGELEQPNGVAPDRSGVSGARPLCPGRPMESAPRCLGWAVERDHVLEPLPENMATRKDHRRRLVRLRLPRQVVSDPTVGFVEVYLNGKLVLPKTYAATLYTGQGVYLEAGVQPRRDQRRLRQSSTTTAPAAQPPTRTRSRRSPPARGRPAREARSTPPNFRPRRSPAPPSSVTISRPPSTSRRYPTRRRSATSGSAATPPAAPARPSRARRAPATASPRVIWARRCGSAPRRKCRAAWSPRPRTRRPPCSHPPPHHRPWQAAR